MSFVTYQQTIDYLFSRLPNFQRQGAPAYKPGLGNIVELCAALGNPERHFPSVHIAGTNGKGSTAHSLAAFAQTLLPQHKIGLYTSPHLKDFTERIRVNGEPVPEEWVIKFTNQILPVIEKHSPSFFEITVAMAFAYFKEVDVSLAIIETGMGGRLDSTNIINPIFSLITNISFDHEQFLGPGLENIAREKAGIIKPEVPVIISHTQPEIAHVFKTKAEECNSPITFAEEVISLSKSKDKLGTYSFSFQSNTAKVFQGELHLDLNGDYQLKNLYGIILGTHYIYSWAEKTYQAEKNFIEALQSSLSQVCQLTGLRGRWDVLNLKPLVIADTGHNEDGIKQVVSQLKGLTQKQTTVIMGAVKDKDLNKILPLWPEEYTYIFTQPKIERALSAVELAQKAEAFNLKGEVIEDLELAITKALKNAQPEDLIFIGGSTFVVAEIPDWLWLKPEGKKLV